MMAEYIGVRSEDVYGCDINGNPVYNMYLTDTEIIRCRDCKHFVGGEDGFPVCMRGWVVLCSYDDGISYKLRVEVDPNGFCAWAERDE